MRSSRRCSRNGCGQPAVATLTYVYADSTAVVGPLAALPEPHTYDLCQAHAASLTAPRGWHLVRHDGDDIPAPPDGDDLAAIADAVRERPDDPAPDRRPRPGPGRRPRPRPGPAGRGDAGGSSLPARRDHLRVLPPS